MTEISTIHSSDAPRQEPLGDPNVPAPDQNHAERIATLSRIYEIWIGVDAAIASIRRENKVAFDLVPCA